MSKVCTKKRGGGVEAKILSQIITFCIEFLVAFLCCCLVLLGNSLFECFTFWRNKLLPRSCLIQD